MGKSSEFGRQLVAKTVRVKICPRKNKHYVQESLVSGS
jgi:hypothetical protein